MVEPKPNPNPLFLRHRELDEAVDLLFFAYRDFSAATDDILARNGLGRAHHRALHFIARQPGITVGGLAATLQVTKQSLGRVLQRLTEQGLVHLAPGDSDRRQRLLHTTASGDALMAALDDRQRQILGQAFRRAGAEAVAGFSQVLGGLHQRSKS